MAILPEVAERLAVVYIRRVHVNPHIHGQVDCVLVQVLINTHAVELDIREVVEQHVMENTKAVPVQVGMNGNTESAWHVLLLVQSEILCIVMEVVTLV
mgnify:CR=1 FL=1